MYTLTELSKEMGLSYRVMDYHFRTGYLPAGKKEGKTRKWTEAERRIIVDYFTLLKKRRQIRASHI